MQEHPHLPKRERQKGWLPAILLSGAVHGVLFLGLFTVFQWQTRAEFVYAELWAPEDVSGGNDPTGVAERVEAPEPTPEPIPEEPKPEEPQPEETPPEETPPEEPARLEETLARLEEERKAEVFLKPEEVSLAIGKGGLNIKLASMLTEYTIDVFREVDESTQQEDEDIYLDEFRDEIEGWVIDAIKGIGIETAKAVLNAPREMLIEQADLEEETVDEVIRVLKKEFEEE